MKTLLYYLLLPYVWLNLCNGEEFKTPPKPSLPQDAPPKNPLSRGWNDDIEWITLEKGLELAKENRKPVFVLIHKNWCHACQSLKKTFSKAKAIQELSKHFNMVNCEDDEEPWEEEYQPDGGKYVPRLLFVDPDGEVLKDVRNPKEEFKEYPYYYSNPAPIITAMRQVVNKYGLAPGETDQKKDIKKEKQEDKQKEDESKKEEKEEKEEKKDEKPKKEEKEKPKEEEKIEKKKTKKDKKSEL